MVQIKQKRGTGVESPSPRSFLGGQYNDGKVGHTHLDVAVLNTTKVATTATLWCVLPTLRILLPTSRILLPNFFKIKIEDLVATNLRILLQILRIKQIWQILTILRILLQILRIMLPILRSCWAREIQPLTPEFTRKDREGERNKERKREWERARERERERGRESKRKREGERERIWKKQTDKTDTHSLTHTNSQ